MLRGLKWKFIIYAAITVFAILLLLPNLYHSSCLHGLPRLFQPIRFVSVSIYRGGCIFYCRWRKKRQ